MQVFYKISAKKSVYMEAVSKVNIAEKPLEIEPESKEKDLLSMVYDVACDFFEFMSECVAIPYRMLGSKHFSILGAAARLPLCVHEAIRKGSLDGFATKLFCLDSGYQYFPSRNASKEEVKDNLGYAAICSYIARDNTSWLKPFEFEKCDFSTFCKDVTEISPDFEVVSGCLISRSSGLKMSIIKTESGYCVVFGAVNSLAKTLDTKNIFHDLDVCVKSLDQVFRSAIGIRSKLYKSAEKAFDYLQKSEKLKGEKITLTGGCFGASIAAYLGIKFEKKTTCFNPLSLGIALLADIGEEKLKNAPKYVTNFISKTDFVADLPFFVTLIDYTFNTLGVKTAGVFGEKLYVERAYGMYSMDTHTGSFNNLLKHIDLDINLRPKDFPQDLIDHIKAKS